ncbi:MAG: cobaltochelatase subunit CobT [SAR324 cluster bacterium]|nr:cobaltochelatase subunit CobT [SAR324 cluster bacterium]
MRAISRQSEVSVTFSSSAPLVRNKPSLIPLPSSRFEYSELVRSRGAADAYALRLRYHDESLHQKLKPESGTALSIFEATEDARLAAIGSADMKGVGKNLAVALEERLKEQESAGRPGDSLEELGESLGLLVREKLMKAPLLPRAKAHLDQNREWLEEHLPGELDSIAELLHDQQGFAMKFRHIIEMLGFEEELGPPPEEEPEQSEEDEEQENPQDDDESGEDDGSDASQFADGEEEGELDSDQFDMDEDSDDSEEETDAISYWRPQIDFDRISKNFYSAYTTKFDELVRAEDLCDPESLSRLRKHLDYQLEPIKNITARLATWLQRRLMAIQQRSWDFGLDEGILDTAQLAGVITNPVNSLSFKREKDTEFRDTVVSLLIDCSGSMRGRPMTVAAMCADLLAQTLERCSVQVEILGFTTVAWKGGRSREHWLSSGKPENPGRLNDLRHIIYKDADIPYRRARKNLGLMMREDLLKENIDGEALLWAHNRIACREEQRKIMMVISDGLPVDNSTLLVNKKNYLERHLHAVIDVIEKQSPVELVAIGIGHDVTHYYKRAVRIADVGELGKTMIEQLTDLFDINKNTRRS